MKRKIFDFFKKHYGKTAILLVFVTGLAYSNNYFEISKNIDIFTTLYQEVNTYYVDEINSAELMRRGIDAMLSSLDPYTTFISESEIEDYRFMTTGQYGGVGASISRRGDFVMVSEIYEGFPADKAGIRAGDIIKEVDGASAKGLSTSQVSDLLKGQPNSELKLLLERPGKDEPMEILVTREEVQIANVPYYGIIGDNIAYVKLSAFKQGATNDVRNALNELRQQHDLNGVVLDLRGNPGGLLNEAVSLTNLFVNRGEMVVSTRGRVKEWENDYKTRGEPWDLNIPLTVLVSESSASASEIVSGAVQDLDRGVVIGQKTFGKGLVQTTRPLSYNSQLKITTAKYYIPSGRCIQAIDYSDRTGSGSVVKSPDSLRTVFYTRNGRKVFDAEGILPDINIEQPEASRLTRSLLSDRMIFDFATHFRNRNEQISKPDEFSITDEIFSEFEAFIEEKEFTYTSSTELALSGLEAEAKDEKFKEEIESYLTALRNKVENMKQDLVSDQRDEISVLLKDEIVGRYYYRKGRIISSFTHDHEILKALEVLGEEQKYSDILTVAN